jgi:type IV pilus assembly protein PilB
MKLSIPNEELKNKILEDSLITPELLVQVEDEATLSNKSLTDTLLAKGIIDGSYLENATASFFNVAVAHLSVETINASILRLIPEDVARQRQAILFEKGKDGVYEVAMLDPTDLETIQFLSQYLRGRVRPYLSNAADMNVGYAVYGMQTADDFKKLINENIRASLRASGKKGEEAAAELPIVAIADNLLSFALASRASDIHIEVLEDATLIRYRVDGILHEVMRIPKEINNALVARFKLLSGLKLDEHYKPQDGRFRYQIVNQTMDVRVSVMPTYYGEKIVMRLLEASQKPLSLEEIGMSPFVKRVVTNALQRTFGMFLSTGPTGSGKSTTLYAMMNIVNKPGVNVVTIEDPIEYNMKYVNQTQINAQAGITFAGGLRALLRQDPNIIMVGEIRDAETAEISIQAALTGHLLLSTLHTNDAGSTIPRLFDLSVQPFLVASVLNVILAQRLVRKICSVCIYSYDIDETTRETVRHQMIQADPANKNPVVPTVLYRGKGCNSCGGTGYRGRIGIYEAIEINDSIKTIIAAATFDPEALRKAARANGTTTMFEDGLEKAQVGVTSLEEVLRVIKE